MKKILLTVVCAGAMMVSAFAQLLDEKNVTITMDLQPVLQLNLQGPDQVDFTFDNIASYYSGITKYGANILKVSASVSFDLWAVGLSQGQQGDFLWDQVIAYQGGGASAQPEIPITALELRQFPGNPSVTAAALCPLALTVDEDYADFLAPYDVTTNDFAAGDADNNIYTASNTTPYLAPTTAGAVTGEKYIAGASATTAGCSQAGGSYLLEALTGGTPTTAGYFFVMDYRLLPGLPAQFPCSDVLADVDGALVVAGCASAAAVAGQSNFDADDASQLDVAGNYAAPGVYTMYIKYILVEDQ